MYMLHQKSRLRLFYYLEKSYKLEIFVELGQELNIKIALLTNLHFAQCQDITDDLATSIVDFYGQDITLTHLRCIQSPHGWQFNKINKCSFLKTEKSSQLRWKSSHLKPHISSFLGGKQLYPAWALEPFTFKNDEINRYWCLNP